jgi:hypothetical protein
MGELFSIIPTHIDKKATPDLPPKNDPMFMLGSGQGDRSKCREKATPSNGPPSG